MLKQGFWTAVFWMAAFSFAGAQQSGFPKVIFVNPSVDKTVLGDDYEPMLISLNHFFRTKDASYEENAYWLPEDMARWVFPYMDLYDQGRSVKHNQLDFYRPTWLQVVRTDVPDAYVVKIAYMGQEEGGFSSLKFIYNLYAKKINGSFFFGRVTDYVTRDWPRLQLGPVTFIGHPGRDIDSLTAQGTADYSQRLASFFETKPIAFTYYSCKNPRQLFEVRGYEYVPNMYFDETGGLCEHYSRSVYSGQDSEWYPHELVHLYTRQVFPQQLNHLADEGVATYLGGSGNSPLVRHLEAMRTYKAAHPEADLAELLYVDRDIAEHTSSQYTLGGLLCQCIVERHGKKGLWRWLGAGNIKSEQMNVLAELLDVETDGLGKFLEQELMK